MPRQVPIEQLAGAFRVGLAPARGWFSAAQSAHEAYLCFDSPEVAAQALELRANLPIQGRYVEVFRACREEALGLGG
eukprot:4828718-Alexandrium_andersonii.AAC.1